MYNKDEKIKEVQGIIKYDDETLEDEIYNLNCKFKVHPVYYTVNGKEYYEMNYFKPLSQLKVSKKFCDNHAIGIFKERTKKHNRSKAQKRRYSRAKFVDKLEDYILQNHEFPPIDRAEAEKQYGNIDWSYFESKLNNYKNEPMPRLRFLKKKKTN